MRAVQEKKGGRKGESEREEKGVWHAIPTQEKRKEMNHIQRLVQDIGVCVLGGGLVWRVFSRSF